MDKDNIQFTWDHGKFTMEKKNVHQKLNNIIQWIMMGKEQQTVNNRQYTKDKRQWTTDIERGQWKSLTLWTMKNGQ